MQQGESLRLGLRNLYILPSRFGGLWLAGAGLLLVVGIQTQRNGPFLLGYLLLALLLLALHLTHFNLQGLELRCGQPRPGFAGETLLYPIHLRSTCPREAISLRLAGPTSEGGSVPLRLSAGSRTLGLTWSSTARGLQRPGPLLIRSSAPLGLFVCWSRWQPARTQIVYPARHPGPVAAAAAAGSPPGTAEQDQGLEGSDHWHDLRPQRPQDSQSRLAWKVLAQGRGRLSKTFRDPAGVPLLLAPDPGVPRERALEHLSAAVWQRSQRGECFGLVLPAQSIPPGRGREHRERCLQALALSR
ncbi:MAG: hypothetical protein FJ054_04280 [Cyanobacteria bacterium M_surface_10_m2_119]|nr:hypothetical protein [Cyanobacteria bacterium M_surface_10_m2_119]